MSCDVAGLAPAGEVSLLAPEATQTFLSFATTQSLRLRVPVDGLQLIGEAPDTGRTHPRRVECPGELERRLDVAELGGPLQNHACRIDLSGGEKHAAAFKQALRQRRLAVRRHAFRCRLGYD